MVEPQIPKDNSMTLVDSINASADRAERAAAILKIENDRQENIMARQRLGGVTSGAVQEAKPIEETALAYSKRLMGLKK